MLALTSDFHGESRNSAAIKKNLEKIALAGFSHVHWCHEWNGIYLYSPHEMIQIREWCGEYGFKVKGVHATAGESGCDLKDYISHNDYNRLAGVDLVKNRVDLAHCLNAEAIVLHLRLPRELLETESGRNLFFRPVLKSFDEMEPYCRTRRIKICMENLPESLPEHSCYMYDLLFNRYDEGFMGLCLDTGHALITCKDDCLMFAKRYNDRLFMIHAHDNNGEKDEHLIPFEGGFDWEGFAPLLARSPYQPPVLIESALKGDGNESLWLKKAFEEGSRFSKMAEKLRN